MAGKTINVVAQHKGVLGTLLHVTPGASPDQSVVVSGNAFAGDGGEGLARWDASDSSTVANGTSVWGTGVGRWKRILTAGSAPSAVLAASLSPPVSAAEPAFIRGVNGAFDGSLGLALWDPTSTETADGRRIFGSGTGRHKLLVHGLLNFEEFFGAKGNDSFDNTNIWAEAIDYCSRKSAGLFVPPGKYGITAGAIQSTNYRDVFIKGVGRIVTPGSGQPRSSEIFLDSSDVNSSILTMDGPGIYSTLKCSGMIFSGSNLKDRAGIIFKGYNPHTFVDCTFLSLSKPILYKVGGYHQNVVFRDVTFTEGGTIHSEVVDVGVGNYLGLVVTLMRLDNVHHENNTADNTEKIVMDLRGCRQIVAHNLLLEGAVPSSGWTALRIDNHYEAKYTRSPFAIFSDFHCEFSGVNVLQYSVQQVGGTAHFHQLAGFAEASAPKYKISGSGRVIIEGSGFVGTAEDPADYFDVEDNTCAVEFHNCTARSPARERAGFTHHNTIHSESGTLPTQLSNDSAQEIWRWRGGYLAAEGVTQGLAGGTTVTPSTDATFGRKLVVTPSGGTLGLSIQVDTKGAISAGDQCVVMVRCKLPTFTGGQFGFTTILDGVTVGLNYKPIAFSNTIVSMLLPFKMSASATRLGISLNQGTATGMSGTLEVYAVSIFHGESVPRRLVPQYPVNVLTHNTAAPAAGAWAVGDVVKNSAPSVGNPKGWVCTVAGTPGTWVSEGNL